MTKASKVSEVTGRGAEPRPRLGRGLAALLADSQPESSPQEGLSGVKTVPIEFVRSSPRNPRRKFDETDLEDLTASIRERGIIQPIVVRAVQGANDTFEIVAGERRWRAAQRAGLHIVPIIPMQISDREALEFSIIENVQRSDLSAIEEAQGYSQLAAEYGYSHADIGRIIGKSRSHVANTLRLLALPEHTRNLLSSGLISAGHARALLAVDNPDHVADKIVAKGLTVRDIENLNENKISSVKESKTGENDPNLQDVARQLSAALSVDVSVKVAKSNYYVQIKCIDAEQFDFLFQRLSRMREDS